MTTKATLVFGKEPVVLSIEPLQLEAESEVDSAIPYAVERANNSDVILRSQKKIREHVRELESFGIDLEGGKEIGCVDTGPITTNAKTWKLLFDYCDSEKCDLSEVLSRAAQVGIKRKI